MDLRKTRLWGESLQSMVESANRGLESGEHVKLEVPKLGLITKAPPRTGTLIGHLDFEAPARSEHATRLMPIESVLLAERDLREAKEAAPPAKKRHDTDEDQVVLPTHGWHISGAGVRRGLIVVMVLAIGGLKLHARYAPKAIAATPVVESEPVQEASPVLAAQPTPEPSVVAPTVRQRAAVDALASGDYAAAQRTYAELAHGTPGRSAFSEAARILAERTQPL